MKKMPLLAAVLAALVAGATSAAAAGVELQEMREMKVFADIETDTPFGFSIQVPKGAELQQKDKGGYVYYKPVDPMIGYVVKVMPLGSDPGKSAEKATAYVRMMAAGSTIGETRKDATGFTVLLKPMGIGQDVWVFRNGKNAHAIAVCSGPAKNPSTLEAICGSLQVAQ
jgi:hypothetical protein